MATVLDDIQKQREAFYKNKRAEGLGQVAAQGQETQDAIARRFASLGSQGSGAQFGVAQQARTAEAAQGRQVQNDITGQELAAGEGDIARRFQAEQAKQAQEYGTKERVGQQQFASQEAGLGREFASTERVASQNYGTQEAGKQRDFQAGQQVAQNLFSSGEALLGRQFTAQEQAKQQEFVAGQSQASRDLQSRLAADDLALKNSLANMQNAKDQQAYDLAKKQYDVDLETTNFNKFLSAFMAGVPIGDARQMITGGGAGSAVNLATTMQGNQQTADQAAEVRRKQNITISKNDANELAKERGQYPLPYPELFDKNYNSAQEK